MRWKAILFDLDGTLIDSLPDIVQSVNQLRRNRGLGTLTRGFCLPHIGGGAEFLIRGILPELSDPAEIMRAVSEYQQVYFDSPTRSKAFTGVLKGLSELKLQFPDLRFSVVTNKSTRLARKVCDDLLASVSFEVIQGPENLKARKPNAEHGKVILNAMKLEASEVVICGDDPVDAQLAKNLGSDFFGASWGYGKLAEPADPEAQLCNNFSDFCTVFKAANLS